MINIIKYTIVITWLLWLQTANTYAQTYTNIMDNSGVVLSWVSTTRTSSGTVIYIKNLDPYVFLEKLPDTSLAREKYVLDRISIHRHLNGMRPFVYDPGLSAVARKYAKYMRETKRFHHTDILWRNARDRIKQAQYTTKLSRRWEVIAQSSTSHEAYTMLMKSPRHRAILMSTGSTWYNLIWIGNRKGNTVWLLFHNPKTPLKRITFDLVPRIQSGFASSPLVQ